MVNRKILRENLWDLEIGCGKMGVGRRQAIPRVLVLVTLWIVMALTEMRNTRRKQIWGKKISLTGDILTD